jgi:alpha-L-fucosidase
VRSPQDLWEHYLETVGRGGKMMLNVPPDNRGLVCAADSISLREFGAIVKKTFSKNLAAGAKIVASNVRGEDNKDYGPKNLLDGSPFTYWSTDDDVLTPQLTITLPEKRTFDLIRLRENIKLGQRIDSLSVDAWMDGGWQHIAGASSIGSNRLIRLDQKITADRLRINIIKAPVCVALSDFALFEQP